MGKIKIEKLWPAAAGLVIALLVTYLGLGISPDIRAIVAACAFFGGLVVTLIMHGLTPGA